jgi:hypothetical protein
VDQLNELFNWLVDNTLIRRRERSVVVWGEGSETGGPFLLLLVPVDSLACAVLVMLWMNLPDPTVGEVVKWW